MKLIEAIAKMEGYGADPENIPTRHNNPGDICAGQWANAHGAVPGAADPASKDAHSSHFGETSPSRYAVFKQPVDGWDALRTLLTEHYLGMTLASAISKYAPATENDTDEYIAAVCKWTGLSPLSTLTAENIG